jgi:HAD superfamily hydrolase (TIGR01509 family)
MTRTSGAAVLSEPRWRHRRRGAQQRRRSTSSEAAVAGRQLASGGSPLRAVAPAPTSAEALSVRWRASLDASAAALRAARGDLSPGEIAARMSDLKSEREATLRLLKAVARAHGDSGRFLHLTPRADLRRLLALPFGIDACVFNLDGVLVGSAKLHAAAWATALDEFIWARNDRTGGRFAPFHPVTDYAEYMHARTRLDGVRGFLASRGIRLPEGSPGDEPGAETVHGLANRKRDLLRRRLAQHGVVAYEGALHYLEAAAEVGIRSAVVSASSNTPTVLEQSGLARLIDTCVDGNTMVTEGLRPKPAADVVLAACRGLGVEPVRAAAFETSPAGVQAARAAGCEFVVGIDHVGRPDALLASGATSVVPGLAELFEQRLAA